MARDKYGHYVNDEDEEINVATDKKGTDHINIYDSCPADNPDHGSIHIDWDSNTGKGQIVDTTCGEKETTDVSCYLTTACMKHMKSDFDDNRNELMTLRWFRDNFVSKEDILHYYEVAPIIVEKINSISGNIKVYDWIYENVVSKCVEAIQKGDYEFAYSRYKNSVLTLEKQFVKKEQNLDFGKILKLKLN